MNLLKAAPGLDVKHLVIVAGEESGDMHAAHLVAELRARHPEVQVSGIGGKHLKASGATIIFELAQYGVTGLTEVLKHAFIINKAFKAIKAHLTALKPDVLLLVDYPGFNLRLARFAKVKLNLTVLYYISPQIWAWKAKRIQLIQQYVDHMAVILPFEKPLYEQAGVSVSFVGHPLTEQFQNGLDADSLQALRSQLHLPTNKKIVAMLPGSRRNEIEHHMPVLIKTIKKLILKNKDLHFVVPIADSLGPSCIERYCDTDKQLPIQWVLGQARAVMACADVIVVASGTASLECALSLKPMCIIYRSSRLTYMVAMQVIKVKYLGLCNLLQNKMIVPEFLQDDCNADELSKAIGALLGDEQQAQAMQRRLLKLKQSLSKDEADQSLYELVASMLFQKPALVDTKA